MTDKRQPDHTLESVRKVTFTYVDHHGQTLVRTVQPTSINFNMLMPWYPTPRWLLSAWDLDKNDFRTFDMNKVSNWKGAEAS